MTSNIIKIPVGSVKSIHNLNEKGSCFETDTRQTEHVELTFLESLMLYCEAVDAGHEEIALPASHDEPDPAKRHAAVVDRWEKDPEIMGALSHRVEIPEVEKTEACQSMSFDAETEQCLSCGKRH
jgi:hypothetical protein